MATRSEVLNCKTISQLPPQQNNFPSIKQTTTKMRFFTLTLAALFAANASAFCSPGETTCGAGGKAFRITPFYMRPALP
jgi:hypothetical protein